MQLKQMRSITILTICGLFNAKAILVVELLSCYLTHSWRNKGFMPFLRVLFWKWTYYYTRLQWSRCQSRANMPLGTPPLNLWKFLWDRIRVTPYVYGALVRWVYSMHSVKKADPPKKTDFGHYTKLHLMLRLHF